jgi:hypothetical protein
MNDLPVFLQALAAIAVLIGYVLVVNAPGILASRFQANRDDFEREMAQQAEIERKLAIAEAAAAARQRGERFVPPADYDR